ncbi:hypothetical protein HMPREF0813_01550 [Streptococcus anginosus F0211]|uniref:Uncharacterized protein n=1 Tax=Streptococcus anginosus F0211 TaxID=706437 RepID=E6J2R0_STRAP|nr:hypothetical protein HMPREF0813_01550 [Streptococcus anginosus F0211]EUB12468.1 hypothetical protein HMPREF1510_1703 [Streptococcus sp. ACC21]
MNLSKALLLLMVIRMRLFLNLEYVIDSSLSRAFRFNKILRVLGLGNLF